MPRGRSQNLSQARLKYLKRRAMQAPGSTPGASAGRGEPRAPSLFAFWAESWHASIPCTLEAKPSHWQLCEKDAGSDKAARAGCVKSHQLCGRLCTFYTKSAWVGG